MADDYARNVAADAEELARDGDALVNALADGPANQTISVRCALARNAGKRWGCWACAALSVLVQRGHCDAVLTDKPLPWWAYVRAGLCFAAVPAVVWWAASQAWFRTAPLKYIAPSGSVQEMINNIGRLGCLSHSKERAALLPSARYGAILPPQFVPLPSWQPEPYDNNANPTCTVCALAHSARAWSVKFGDASTDISIPVSAIDKLFCDATGTPLAEIAASDGADPLDIVETAQAKGWDIGGQVPYVPDFRVAANTPIAIASAVAHVGAAMLALTLYEADMEAAQAGRVWDGAPSGAVVGGHMVTVGAYDNNQVKIATWGMWQPATWAWLASRLQLTLVAGWRQLLEPAQDYAAIWNAAV